MHEKLGKINYDTVQSVVMSHFLSSQQKIWSLISRCQKIIRSLYCPTIVPTPTFIQSVIAY